MNEFPMTIDGVVIILLVILAFSLMGLIITIALYFAKKSGLLKRTKKITPSTSRRFPETFIPGSDNISTNKFTQSYSRIFPETSLPDSDDIRDYGINEILSSGKFSPAERKAEYRRRGKSPSGVIDGVYNDSFRANDSYNDSFRDWDADA